MAAGSAPGAGAGPGRRIGVFGGTFDPPHVGHLVPALFVAESLALDVVLHEAVGVPLAVVVLVVLQPLQAGVDRLGVGLAATTTALATTTAAVAATGAAAEADGRVPLVAVERRLLRRDFALDVVEGGPGLGDRRLGDHDLV